MILSFCLTTTHAYDSFSWSESQSYRKYPRSFEELIGGVHLLDRGFDMLDDEVLALSARVRAQMQVDRPVSVWKHWRKRKSATPTPEAVAQERPRIDEEIEDVRTRSRKKIDKYFGPAACDGSSSGSS